MKKYPLSIIIPVYNEMRTVGSIIEIIRSWGRAKEIIVVDDGSTDKTYEVLLQFSESIRIIRIRKNEGKSEAIIKGVQASTERYIMFLDGDLLGLTHEVLTSLMQAMLGGSADLIIGARGIHKGIFISHKEFGGERVVRREDIIPLLPKLRHVGFGAEVILNNAYSDKRIVYVPLPYLSHYIKIEKYGLFRGFMSYIKEGIEVIPRHLYHTGLRGVVRAGITFFYTLSSGLRDVLKGKNN